MNEPVLDATLLALAARRVAPRIAERHDAFTRDLARKASQFAARGVAGSGQHFVEILLACTAEIDARATMAWEILAEVVTTARIPPTNDLAEAIKNALDQIMLPHLRALRHQLPTGDDLPHLAEQFERAINRAREKVQAEVDLFVLSLRQRAGDSAAASPFQLIARPPVAGRTFLSHAATEQRLAEHVRDAIMTGAPDGAVFMASRPGAIQPGRGWFDTILRELHEAARYVVLLTPASHDRLWVAFETGAACLTGRPLVLLCAAGLKPGTVAYPLAGLQLLSLDEGGIESVREAFRVLEVNAPADPEAFLARAHVLGREAVEAAADEEGWKSVRIADRIYGWEGPLDHMADREPVPETFEFPNEPEVREAFAAAGVQLIWVRPEGVRRSSVAQVFITDRRTWRRPIICGDVVLGVRLRPS